MPSQQINVTEYCDIFSCACFLLQSPPFHPLFHNAIHDFKHYSFNVALREPPLSKYLYEFSKHSKESLTPLSSNQLCTLTEAAMYVIMFHHSNLTTHQRFLLVEKTAYENSSNPFILSTYAKTALVFKEMFNSKYSVSSHTSGERFVNCLTFHPGINRPQAIDAHLSCLSLMRQDYSRMNFFPAKLSATSEAVYMKAFTDFMSIYTQIDRWEGPVRNNLLKAVYHFTRNYSSGNLAFLKERISHAYEQRSISNYWNMFENASSLATIFDYISEFLSDVEIKAVCDFCLLVLMLTLWYGNGTLMKKAITQKKNKLRHKYGDCAFFDKIALFVLPIGFSFLNAGAHDAGRRSEHKEIVRAMRSIAKDIAITPLTGSFIWARDKAAWLDQDFSFLIKERNTQKHIARRGLICEGGNIIPGTQKTKFILVSQEAVGGDMDITGLHLFCADNKILLYTLPGGFSYLRNAATHEYFILDSNHIDTVINIIPGCATASKTIKIIVDPHYYEIIKNNPEFLRLLQEQGIAKDDVVIIDKDEAHLSLANFSTLRDSQGKMKLLFNKDKNITLPKIGLQHDSYIQPSIEINNLAPFNGGLRCVSAALPLTQMEHNPSTTIQTDKSVPQDIEKALVQFLCENRQIVDELARSWILKLFIKHKFQQGFYEFDVLSRIGYITLGFNECCDTPSALTFMKSSIKKICISANLAMGVSTQTASTHAKLPPSHAAEFENKHIFITNTGKLIPLLSSKEGMVPV